MPILLREYRRIAHSVVLVQILERGGVSHSLPPPPHQRSCSCMLQKRNIIYNRRFQTGQRRYGNKTRWFFFFFRPDKLQLTRKIMYTCDPFNKSVYRARSLDSDPVKIIMSERSFE